jgi:hypothetical protein
MVAANILYGDGGLPATHTGSPSGGHQGRPCYTRFAFALVEPDEPGGSCAQRATPCMVGAALVAARPFPHPARGAISPHLAGSGAPKHLPV